ncbi:MAG: SIR2 family protein [Synergistaceae bacterium]|jgi:hypothetical protein|nr:SIR2 family protein [Synergistaceae bacterium]
MIKRIFEIIRKGEAVFWIGAGFSKYAGYPLANDLSKIIFDELNDAEKKEANLYSSYEKIAQDYVDLKGKEPLIDILRENYATKVPDDTRYHDMLSKIPHIKTVVTTNFDTLLENAYKCSADLIVGDSDVSKIKDNRTAIIKVHGDFKHPSKLIITSDDYSRYITTGFNSSIWSVVVERLLTKYVIFIGYSIDDPNAIALIERVSDQLGESRKEFYFVAPSISAAKMNNLKSRRIVPVLITGEEFVKMLYKNIEDNILIDVQRKDISIDICSDFLSFRGLTASYITNNNKITVTDFKSPVKDVHSQTTFTISDLEIAKLIHNTSIDEIVIPVEKLVSFELRIDGLRHPISELSELKNIIISPISEITKTDFIFKDRSINVRGIKTEIIKARNVIRFDFGFDAGLFRLKIQLNESDNVSDDSRFKITGQINFSEEQTSTSSVIDFLSFILKILKGNEFVLHTTTDFNFQLKLPLINSKIVKEFEAKLNYYQQLKVIEDFFLITFSRIMKITESDVHNASILSKAINGSILNNSEDQSVKLEFVQNSDSSITASIDEDKLTVHFEEEERVRIHNYELILGERIFEVIDPKYSNRNEFESGKDSSLFIFCKAGKFLYNFANIINANRLVNKIDVQTIDN